MNLNRLLLTGWLLVLLVACGSQAQPLNEGATGRTTGDEQESVETEAHEEETHSSDEQASGDDHEHENGDEKHRDLEAHEHGVAELMLAWSGDEIAIDLRTPAHNVVGFEHAPETEEEQALLTESLQTLKEGELLRILPAEAGCVLTGAEVHTELADGEEHADEEAAEGAEESHSEIDVEYTLRCENADAIEALDASELFAHFPNFAELHVQWVSDSQQSAKELTTADAVVPLK